MKKRQSVLTLTENVLMVGSLGAAASAATVRIPGALDLSSAPLRSPQVVLVVKNPPANAGDMGLVPGSGGSPGGGPDNPLQHPCLENPMERGAWWATVHGATESTRLKQLSMHACTMFPLCTEFRV